MSLLHTQRSTILDLYACRRICLKNDWNRMEFLLTFGYFKFVRFQWSATEFQRFRVCFQNSWEYKDVLQTKSSRPKAILRFQFLFYFFDARLVADGDTKKSRTLSRRRQISFVRSFIILYDKFVRDVDEETELF